MPHALTTRAVHAGREDLRDLGVHALPIDLSSTYPFRNLDAATHSLDAFVGGAAHAEEPIYSRLFNPTVDRFEKALAHLEHAEAAVAFGSGMAALTAVLLAAQVNGRHVIAIRPIYGTTDHLLSTGLLGTEVTWVDPHGVSAAVRPDTSLVLLETPANPTLAGVDIAAVVRQAGSVPVLVDNTFATPILQQPLVCGAALVMHSATKFLGGHGDVIAGVVAGSEAWMARLRQVRILTGGLLHPLGAYLLHRGLPTLPLRIERAQSSAQLLAERLLAHPAVTRVFFPGLHGQDPLGLIGRQVSGPGTLLAFELREPKHARRLLEAVRIATPAVSLGSVDTLIQHPAGLTHRVVPEATRKEAGISEGLIRYSVGLEDPEDLWADLVQGLEA